MNFYLVPTLVLLQVIGELRGEWDVKTCPKLCRCLLKVSRRLQLPLKTVECNNRKLLTIPPTTPTDTQSLILKGNKIKAVHDHLPALVHLVELDLSYNYLQTLGSFPMFQNLTVLTYADFSHNQLNALLHGSFSGARDLKYLYLGYNRLHTPETHAFAGINQLVNLTLNKNKLTKIDREWFTGMKALQNLNMDDNELAVLGSDVFQDLTRLSRLLVERNNISEIEHGAFRTLTRLDYLSLLGNRLATIPVGSFTTFSNLKFLILDRNPVRFVVAGSFEFINVREVSLCNMLEMEMVDSHAFTNLPFLSIVHMHDNPKLVYLDGAAFARVPSLSKLYIHNNNLIALPQKLLDYLPKLAEISYYHNPVKCNCNARWIREQLMMDANKTKPLFSHADRLACATPDDLANVALTALPVSAFQEKCAPTVMAFFNSSYQKALGGSISLNCRAIGVPEPQISWIISNGRVVNASSNYNRIKFMLGNLTIYYLRATDGGTYTCVVANAEGFDTTYTVLKIHSRSMNVIPLGVASNFITVTWNSTGNTMSRSKYLLMYKRQNSADKYKGIHLRTYMRTYTIMNLKPKTTYKFCIAYEHMSDIVYINCRNITTRRSNYMLRGITHYSSVAIIVGLITTVAVVVFLCLAITAVKNYRKRKHYKEPDSSSSNAPRVVNPKVENMSQIPLDNIYNPPSTPIYSSTTSLIPHSQA